MEHLSQHNVLHSWAWRELPIDETKAFSYAHAEVVTDTPVRYEKLHYPIERAELSSIQAYMSSVSLKHMSDILYRMFTVNLGHLFDSLDYAQDGSVALGSDILDTVATANAIFSNVVTAGKRLIDKLEDYLSEAYGKDSKELSDWNKLRHDIYDKSFSYALCYELRNVYQHEFLVINLVGIDAAGKRGWLVFNFDHEIIEKGLKPGIKIRIGQFIEKKKANGDPGRINIFQAASGFYTYLTFLYLRYCELIAAKVLHDANQAEVVLADKPNANCLIYAPRNIDPDWKRANVYWIYEASVRKAKDAFKLSQMEFERFMRELDEEVFGS